MTGELVGLDGSMIALKPFELSKPKFGLSANKVVPKPEAEALAVVEHGLLDCSQKKKPIQPIAC